MVSSFAFSLAAALSTVGTVLLKCSFSEEIKPRKNELGGGGGSKQEGHLHVFTTSNFLGFD